MYVYIYIYIYICMYTYDACPVRLWEAATLHTHTHTHTHAHTHTITHSCSPHTTLDLQHTATDLPKESTFWKKPIEEKEPYSDWKRALFLLEKNPVFIATELNF